MLEFADRARDVHRNLCGTGTFISGFVKAPRRDAVRWVPGFLQAKVSCFPPITKIKHTSRDKNQSGVTPPETIERSLRSCPTWPSPYPSFFACGSIRAPRPSKRAPASRSTVKIEMVDLPVEPFVAALSTPLRRPTVCSRSTLRIDSRCLCENAFGVYAGPVGMMCLAKLATRRLRPRDRYSRLV